MLRTNASFTIAAWVKLDDLNADKVILSQPGSNSTTQSFQLMYKAGDGWRFQMASADSATPTFLTATAPATADWTHLAAVYDIHTAQMTLYVGGEKAATGAGPKSPWHFDGKLRLGCLATAAGSGRGLYLTTGSVDEARAWTSTVDSVAIADLARS